MTDRVEEETTSVDVELPGPVSAGRPQGGAVQTPAANVASGTLQAFRDIRRELTEQELSNSGVQKLILDRLDNALSQCDRLSGFEARFHEADKRVGVLETKLEKRVALDIAWGAAVAIGLAMLGLTPTMWDIPSKGWAGWVWGIVSALLIVGGVAIRVVLR